MKMTEQLRAFIRMHQNDDVNKLLLSAARYPEIDMPFAVEQLVSRRQIKDKLPSWYANDGLLFPAKIAAEQCS
ncbi:MAG: SAM-dependent methyltransferase, partial [Parabacteroides sp.]|nr:SAM-dependent methyltransferase [Parabacteroides sp.]